MRLSILLGAAAWLCGAAAAAQEVPRGHEAAIAAIRKLGGEVKVDAAQPGRPVAVVLAGVRSPTECLPYLERIDNLHTCDF